MVLAAFCSGAWVLRGALRSEDTELLGQALEVFGARVSWQDRDVVIESREGGAPEGEVFLGENATGLRLLLAVVPALGGRLTIDGRQPLRTRPLEPSLELLRSIGATAAADRLPVSASGVDARWPIPLEVDASLTTQVASGALLAVVLARGEDEVLVRNPSAPDYVRVTAHVCRQFGWRVREVAQGQDLLFVVSGSSRGGGDIIIPADPSARVFPLTLAALHGLDGPGILPGSEGDPHPDWAVDGDLEKLCAAGEDTLELADIGRRPDCLPALTVMASSRRGFTRFVDLPALRKKESDRLNAMAVGLAAAGVTCVELPDGLIVEGPPAPSGAGPQVLPTAPDHRVVMALSLLGTTLPQGVVVENSHAVDKSWPGFFDWLGRVAVVATVA